MAASVEELVADGAGQGATPQAVAAVTKALTSKQVRRNKRAVARGTMAPTPQNWVSRPCHICWEYGMVAIDAIIATRATSVGTSHVTGSRFAYKPSTTIHSLPCCGNFVCTTCTTRWLRTRNIKPFKHH